MRKLYERAAGNIGVGPDSERARALLRTRSALYELQNRQRPTGRKPVFGQAPQPRDGWAGGLILASVPALAGVMAYSARADEALREVKSLALQVLADMVESGEPVPETLKRLFAA